MTLDTLLLRSGRYGSAYTRDLYFRGCELRAGVLFVPDRAQAQSIAHLFGQDLRNVIADLRITVAAPQAEKPKPTGVIKAQALAKWERTRDLLD